MKRQNDPGHLHSCNSSEYHWLERFTYSCHLLFLLEWEGRKRKLRCGSSKTNNVTLLSHLNLNPQTLCNIKYILRGLNGRIVFFYFYVVPYHVKWLNLLTAYCIHQNLLLQHTHFILQLCLRIHQEGLMAFLHILHVLYTQRDTILQRCSWVTKLDSNSSLKSPSWFQFDIAIYQKYNLICYLFFFC